MIMKTERNPRPTPAARRQHRRQRAQSQEGAVLFLVLMVVLLSAAGATYAVQDAGYEIASAGAAKQALRARYASEAGAMAAHKFVAAQKENVKTIADGEAAADVSRYNLPALVGSTLFWNTNAVRGSGALGSNAGTFSQAAGDAYLLDYPNTLYTTESDTLFDVFTDGSGRVHVTATVFGRQTLTNDVTQTGDLNGIHESVAMSRIFYDVEQNN